jgi:hypothetical protein
MSNSHPFSVDIELDRIVSITEASKLSNLSPDTLRRVHRDKIVRLSPRREGMRIRDALMFDKTA